MDFSPVCALREGVPHVHRHACMQSTCQSLTFVRRRLTVFLALFISQFLSSKSVHVPPMEPKRKRVRDEHDGATISDVTSASPVKKVEGGVVNIFPMKKSKFGCDYFDGRISDGNTSMRFVGYDAKDVV